MLVAATLRFNLSQCRQISMGISRREYNEKYFNELIKINLNDAINLRRNVC